MYIRKVFRIDSAQIYVLSSDSMSMKNEREKYEFLFFFAVGNDVDCDVCQRTERDCVANYNMFI